jgi:polygalacturonase
LGGSITGLNIENTPVQCFSIDSSNGLTITNVTINNKAGDSLGHNTDAFDICDSSNITITGATVYNQDDCLAINSGTNITFTGGLCSGGHGLSIGSVGGRTDNTVETVVIESSTVEASENGVRIKTVSGATGAVKGVTYKNITLKEISKYGIIIEQDYENGSPTGTPTAGVPITDLVIEDVTGTVASAGTNIYILCASGACSSWTWVCTIRFAPFNSITNSVPSPVSPSQVAQLAPIARTYQPVLPAHKQFLASWKRQKRGRRTNECESWADCKTTVSWID